MCHISGHFLGFESGMGTFWLLTMRLSSPTQDSRPCPFSRTTFGLFRWNTFYANPEQGQFLAGYQHFIWWSSTDDYNILKDKNVFFDQNIVILDSYFLFLRMGNTKRDELSWALRIENRARLTHFAPKMVIFCKYLYVDNVDENFIHIRIFANMRIICIPHGHP